MRFNCGIDELVVNHAIDANQVTLLGFSQGSILSLAVALSSKVQKVIGLSGYLNENILKENYQNNDFLI
jgi:phospholipase/carboxylesterase